MATIRKLVLLGAGVAVSKVLVDKRRRSQHGPTTSTAASPGVLDTPTGTDPNAKYSAPGFEDKSLGQAVNQDTELAEGLLAESHGDEDQAEQRFRHESAGAPKLHARHPPEGA